MIDDKHGDPPEAPTTAIVIPAGKAHLHVAGAFLDVFTALHRLEAVCAAVARQLDATSKGAP